MLCGFAIDSGLLYLAKARLSRAVDGASLAAVGNFHQSDDPTTNRQLVAQTMRNFAVINFTDLNSIAASTTEVANTYTLPNGTSGTTYTYNFNDGTIDSAGAYRRYVQVDLKTGAGGQITSATCSARCPAHTYFMGFAGSFFRDMKVSSAAVATRNPRLIMVVVDRSASMLQNGGGAYGLPQAIVSFLDFFDTSSDYIGIVSFSSNARLEMPLTTNFLVAGTNNLFSAYAIDTNANVGVPGPDPEEFSANGDYDPNYATTGVRRLKFGGDTAADEGMRLGLEEMMMNSGFNNPDVQKYLVLFTDGAWNNTRTLLAAPGYTNTVTGPPTYVPGSNFITNSPTTANFPYCQTNLAISVPTLNPWPSVNIEIGTINFTAAQHTNDIWQSVDQSHLEPLSSPGSQLVGAPISITNTCQIGTYTDGTPLYTSTLSVWLQPGAVDYVYDSSGNITEKHVSNFNDPTQTVLVTVPTNGKNVLVVPGYVVDGCFYDGLDMTWPFNTSYNRSTTTYSSTGPMNGYSWDNFNEPFMWPDDAATNVNTSSAILSYSEDAWWTDGTVHSQSVMRQLMFRNYANLLTGFTVFRPDDPLSSGIEHFTGAYRPKNGLGAYYPSAGFYWPFDKVGIDSDQTYALTNAVNDPDLSNNGWARRIAYSINMLSSDAAPEWAGELFYKGTGGTSVVSGTANTSVSSLMSSASDWKTGAPDWLIADFDHTGIMYSDAVHNTNLNLGVQVWRPLSYNGVDGVTNNVIDNKLDNGINDVSPSDSGNYTGGYVTDGNGNYYRNAMAWSGRPTHYFDFSQSRWVAVANNHVNNIQALPLGNWKVQEYAWHARALGVTIYTVGYGYYVNADEQVLLAQIANATNTTAGNAQSPYVDGNGTNIPFNSQQPIGAQFYATTPDEISNKFYFIGQAINAALTQ